MQKFEKRKVFLQEAQKRIEIIELIVYYNKVFITLYFKKEELL